MSKIIGKRFSQASLASQFRSTEFGQSPISRASLIALLACLVLGTGLLLGAIGTGIAVTMIAPPFSFPSTVFLVLSLLLITSIWLQEIVRRGLAASLWKTAFVTLICCFFSILFPGEPLVGAILLFTVTVIGVACLSLVANGLALALISVLSVRKSLKKIYVLLAIASSLLVAFLWRGTIPKDTDYFALMRLSGAFLVSYSVLRSSRAIAKSGAKLTRDFRFVQAWAIALASWGGASFYNLDLSEIDFSGSHLANCDFRAQKLYRTCLKGVTGLERARVDHRYLDLDLPKVQQLLTRGYSDETDFKRTNLQGAHLQDAIMQRFDLTEANLNGANLRGADLRDSILVRTQVTGVDFSGANLTGICIQDWSTNSATCFAGVQCDYVYREWNQDRPLDRYPADRNFEPGEFENLFQEVKNVVELVFKNGVDLRALSFAFQNVQLEDADDLGLQLKGIEQRGDRWIVKVTHRAGVTKQEVEHQLMGSYEILRQQIAAKDQQIRELMGITRSLAAATESYSKQPFGNSFVISGSSITNLAGSGQIEYEEAANQVRELVTQRRNPEQTQSVAQNLLNQFQGQQVATTPNTQTELVQQVILAEAQKDEFFRQFLIQQGQEIVNAMPDGIMSYAFRSAIAQLKA